MLSVFRYDQTLLRASRASDKIADAPVHWRVKARGEQQLKTRARPLVEALEGPGLEVRAVTEGDPRQFSYVRGEFSLTPGECRGLHEYSIDLMFQNASDLSVVLGLYRDEAFTDLVVQKALSPSDDAGHQTLKFKVDFDAMPSLREPLYGYVQIALKMAAAATATVGEFAIRQSLMNPEYRQLRIRFDPFGDETKASARLRVWRFVDILKKEGHKVMIGGADHDVDLYIAQKVRNFGVVKAIRAKNPAAVIVYDFDDNYTLPEEGVLNDLVAFINFVDVVTCGSEYLAQTVRRWHQNVYVLENPVDVADAELRRRPRGALKRVGWFGAPEGLSELERANIARKVETLTKGGDIDFTLATVDQELTGFDLLVFPLEPTPWNLAKNANRMMKALGLGVPVLVGDTPEHRRIHALTGLPAECLVTGAWDDGIDQVKEGFKRVEAATTVARSVIWEHYSPRTILKSLVEHLNQTTRLGGRLIRRQRAASPAFADIAVLVVDGSPEELITTTLVGSAVDWSSFKEVAVCSARRLQIEAFAFLGDRLRRADGEFLSIYREADRFVAQTTAKHLLVMPAGVCLSFGAVDTLETLIAEGKAPIAAFAYAEYFSAAVKRVSGALPLRDLLVSPAPLGPLLVETEWARNNAAPWSEALDLWTWAAAAKALASGIPFATEALPFAFEGVPRPRTTASRNFFYWLQENEPAIARDLPDLEGQWRRIVTDIASTVSADAQSELPIVVGLLHAELLATRRLLEKAQSEVKALKK